VQSLAAPDSGTAKMKGGATHLAYRAEHTVDSGSGSVLAAVPSSDRRDADTRSAHTRNARRELVKAVSKRKADGASLLDQYGGLGRALPPHGHHPGADFWAGFRPEAHGHGRGGGLDNSVAAVKRVDQKRPATRIIMK
jgi:hypothetical protein